VYSFSIFLTPEKRNFYFTNAAVRKLRHKGHFTFAGWLEVGFGTTRAMQLIS
jgi:hypothetical protein